MTIKRSFLVCVLCISHMITLYAISNEGTSRDHTGSPSVRTLYTVSYSHLDTQWRWDYQTTIREYLPATVRENAILFDKYPDYVFNFSGANRYRMLEEYYPEDFQTVKSLVASGRWFPCGSSMEEADAIVPSPESIIRQILYGNGYFRKTFGVSSAEYMLPDCFGFPASLPSILAHCGLRGFSTQKLEWGSAVGIPFNVGVWEGPDGSAVIAALNPGAYVTRVNEDLSHSAAWLERIQNLEDRCGIAVDFMYVGTGDRGGAPEESSIRRLQESIQGDGPIEVLSATAEEMFLDIPEKSLPHLPRFKGEMLLTEHSAGSITSQAAMKRWNRKNECLAYDAEAASVMGDWLGSSTYPMERIREAWRLVLGAQFHDILPGTSIPRAYTFSWNDEIVALNQFASVLTHAVRGLARGMDTRVRGIPVIICNSLSTARVETVEAEIAFAGTPPPYVRVFDPLGREVPSQILEREAGRYRICFLARAPSAGLTVYSVRPAESACELPTGLRVSATTLENERYRVSLNTEGDVVRIYDKTEQRELLSAPIRLAFLNELPVQYPAWNMDWKDREKPPSGFVEGPADIRVVEEGPVRVALEVRREARGSWFVQRIRLSAGEAGERVDFDTEILWNTPGVSLKAVFPLTVSNPNATYNWELGTVERGNNDPKKYEVPSHQWFDLTDTDGSYGVAVLEDCKYGSDKPADDVLRLTLLYTPGIRDSYKDQATQDFGRHEMQFALAGHAGDWRKGMIPCRAKCMNQPLRVFQTIQHRGFLGRSFTFLDVNKTNVFVSALKKAENGDGIILRLQESDGQTAEGVKITFAVPVLEAAELNGQEEEIAEAAVLEGRLVCDFHPYQPRTFRIRLEPPGRMQARVFSRPIDLLYDTDVMSLDNDRCDGAFDAAGHSIPGERMPDTVFVNGVGFKMGPSAAGANNAVSCSGQEIRLPKGDFNRIDMLAASAEGDAEATFLLDKQPVRLKILHWTGFIGQWDKRIWSGDPMAVDYAWDNIDMVGIVPGFIKRDPIVHFTTHRHDPSGENEPYVYTYLSAYSIDLPRNTHRMTLPDNENIRVLAVSAVRDPHPRIRPASPLYDTLDRETEDYRRFARTARPKIWPEAQVFGMDSSMTVRIIAPDEKASVRFTLDGASPVEHGMVYTDPFQIEEATVVKAVAIEPEKGISKTVSVTYLPSRPRSGIRYETRYASRYSAGGDRGLIDGIKGSMRFRDGRWQGFRGVDMVVVVDLGEVVPVQRISTGCLQAIGSWIFLPEFVEYALSEDGETFTSTARVPYERFSGQEKSFVAEYAAELSGQKARYVRVVARNIGVCPDGHPGAGGKAWVFVDEIIVE